MDLSQVLSNFHGTYIDRKRLVVHWIACACSFRWTVLSSLSNGQKKKSVLLSHLTDENIETWGDQLPVITEFKIE